MSGRAVVRTALLLLAVLLVQSTIGTDITIAGVHPDVVWLFPVSAALIGGSTEGAVLGFVSGIAADLLLPTPFGLTGLVGCLLGVVVGQATRGADRSNWWVAPFAALSGSAAAEVAYALLGALLGQQQFLHVHLLAVVLVVSVTNAILALPALRLVRWALARPRPRRRTLSESRW